MATSHAKLIFVLVFVLNCLLWSQSRYASVEGSFGEGLRHQLTPARLLKRSLGIWNEADGDQCMPSKIKFSKQCQHAQEQCPISDTLLSIPYTQAYFCTDETQRPFAFVGLLLWLIFLFSTLGISSSDFFCPNLGTLSSTLGLDENVAGVTFLAFGNGSPDVFSTFAAMRSNTASLAIGELLGAASFIISVVVGSMCIIKPFTVDAYPFLRDVFFFTTAVALLVAVMWDGHLHLWETLSLMGLYILYVLVVVVGTWWSNRREVQQRRNDLVRQEYAQEDTIGTPYRDEEPYRDDSSSFTATPNTLAPPYSRARAISNPNPRRQLSRLELPARPHSRAPTPPRSPLLTPRHTPGHSPTNSISARAGLMTSFSLVGALEFRDIVARLQPHSAGASLGVFETPITPFAGGYYNRPPSRSRSPASRGDAERDPWDEALSGVPLNDRTSPPISNRQSLVETPLVLSALHSDDGDDDDDESHSTVPRIEHIPATPRQAQHNLAPSPTIENSKLPKRAFVRHAAIRSFEILFPTLNNFRGKGILVQLASIFAAPAVFCLTLTLPVVVTSYGSDMASQDDKSPRSQLQTVEGRLIDYDGEAEGIERTLIAEEEVQEDMHDHLRFNKWLMVTQCVLAPLFCAKVLFDGTYYQFWILLAAGIAGLAMAILVGVFANDGRNPAGRFARCLMGFIVAIVWIMAIADEVVNVLQTFGFIFGLSNAIIGLTIFAMGNSLADLVANISVAAFAPIMGFSACFGGPMLNMLLGVGFSGSYIILQTEKAYQLEFSRTLIISSMQLLVLLVMFAIVVPLNGYHLSRQWGFILIASYTVVMSVNVIVELRPL